MSEEFDWQNYHAISASDMSRKTIMGAEYLQCCDCDYIDKPQKFETERESFYVCPSCHSDDIIIVDLSKPYYLTLEQIIKQIAWQEQIKAKGVLQAFADLGIMTKPKEPSEEA